LKIQTNKILIIDDERQIRSALRRTLELHDYEVVESGNGKEAYRYLEHEVPDLVITDVFMPEMDGFETIQNLRRTFPEMPIIVMTGYHANWIRNAVNNLGAVHFLQKPFDDEELLYTIRKVHSGIIT
jgi:YesN/AraC family two-component response regulator